jgi:hypothetical protein
VRRVQIDLVVVASILHDPRARLRTLPRVVAR